MIKKFIITLFIGGLSTFILLQTVYDADYRLQNIVDAAFVVGFILFSFGLITLSNATKVFTGFQFWLKQVFSRKNYTHLAFYDYKMQKEKEREKTTGLPMLLVGLLTVIVTAILSYTQFNV